MSNIRSEKITGNIAVLLGGESSEREVSLKSGNAVIAAFRHLGVDVVAIDVPTAELASALRANDIAHCFVVLHGGDGEDGTVQALLDSLGITFTGSDMLGCAIGMDKYRTKLLWRGAGIPTADFMAVTATTSWQAVEAQLGGKVMIKPAHEGSSIGMAVVDSAGSFSNAMADALRYDSQVIAEKWITGREYTVAILNGKALPMIRLQTSHAFYDYEAKYQSDDTQYICPCGLAAEDEARVQEIAVRAFDLLGCKGWGRIDVMQDADGSFYLLEVNTVPGMTDHSLVPMAAKAAGMSFDELVANIFNLSLG